MKIDNRVVVMSILLSSILLNGCIQKNNLVKPKVVKKKSWEKTKVKKSKKDCTNCYAVAFNDKNREVVQPKIIRRNISSDDLEAPPKILKEGTYEYEEENFNGYVAMEQSVKRVESVELINSSDSSFPSLYSKKRKILQVGAFRHYQGAKKIAKRYRLLSSSYEVHIEKGVKNGVPIYRVRIEGFSSDDEAGEFMSRYGISDAFLVRK